MATIPDGGPRSESAPPRRRRGRVRADREARARYLDIVGFWHSHPDHPARPSQFDTDHAWVDYVYIIVNTTADGAGDLNGFTLAEEGGPFRQLPLMVTPSPGPAR